MVRTKVIFALLLLIICLDNGICAFQYIRLQTVLYNVNRFPRWLFLDGNFPMRRFAFIIAKSFVKTNISLPFEPRMSEISWEHLLFLKKWQIIISKRIKLKNRCSYLVKTEIIFLKIPVFSLQLYWIYVLTEARNHTNFFLWNLNQ